MTNNEFCKFFRNGLVYNNDTVNFTVSPCCYFSNNDVIDPTADIDAQFQQYRAAWQIANVNKTCKICIDQETSNIPSYRQAANDIVTNDVGKITMLTVAVTKKCNLACPSCGSEASSLWHKENLRNGVMEPETIIKMHQEDHEHLIAKKFLSLFETQDLSALRYIKFGGGEPFMSDLHQQILNLVPNPELVTVQYTSNFSLMPTKTVFETWKKFQLIKWCASMDGIGEQFEFLRWPYLWEKFCNFKRQAFDLVPLNVMFGVEHTLNPLNILYFDQFENWFKAEFSVNRLGDVSDFNIHYAGGVMGLNCVTPELKQAVVDKFGPDHRVVKLLNQIPLTGDILQFTDYLDRINRWRNLNWRSIFPATEVFY
jgi:hypothetical protein